MKTITSALLIMVILLSFSVWTLAQTLEWSQRYGGPLDDAGKYVQQTIDGGYIILGKTYSYGAGGSDIWLIKTDASGNQQWSKTFGGALEDSSSSVCQTSDGGYFIVGYNVDLSNSPFDVWHTLLIKTDGDGNKQWDKTIEAEVAYSGEETSDGGYIFAGGRGPILGPPFLTKMDANGNIEWDKEYGGDDLGSWYTAVRVIQTSDGGYVIEGPKTSNVPLEPVCSGIFLIKTDAAGNELWRKIFDLTCVAQVGYGDIGTDVQQTTDGGYIISATTLNPTHPYTEYEALLIKTDAGGDQQWSNIYGTNLEFLSVEQTSDGGYVVTGQTDVNPDHDPLLRDVLLIKTDANGNQEWSESYGGAGIDAGDCVRQSTDGGYIIVGATSSYGAGAYDIWLLKVQGLPPWTPPEISLYPASLSNTCVVGADAPGQSFDIWNSGGLTLNYSITENKYWLSLIPTRGTSAGEHDRITVDYATSGLAQGTYSATITVSAPGCSNSPQQIPVTLTVKGQGDLTQITLISPMNGSTILSPPTFTWIPNGGVNDAFVVDLSLSSPTGPFKTGPIVTTTNWTLPRSAWKRIPAGGHVHWRVRGADQSKKPRTIITSPTWSFYKQ